MPTANPNLISRLLAAEFSWRLLLRTDRLTWISRALSLTGFAIAAYLTTVYLADVPPVCATSGGCVTVQHSAYANIAGIPLPVIGLCGYTLLFITACLPGQRARTAGNGVHRAGDQRERRPHLPGVERDPRDLHLVRRLGELRSVACDRQLRPVRARRANLAKQPGYRLLSRPSAR
jgi:uncharacterized membrane protein